jgi:two-component system response regulator MtrA
MTAPAITRPVSRRPRLRPVPAEQPLTVTISIEGGGPAGRERVLEALRDLVTAAGGEHAVAVERFHHLVPVPDQGGPAGVVSLDPLPRAAFRDGRLLDLSRLEYDLLLFFAQHPRQVFSRAQLLERVWGHVHTGARTVDVHISRLRTKLADPEVITTVYGVGYRLADDAPIRVV